MAIRKVVLRKALKIVWWLERRLLNWLGEETDLRSRRAYGYDRVREDRDRPDRDIRPDRMARDRKNIDIRSDIPQNERQ